MQFPPSGVVVLKLPPAAAEAVTASVLTLVECDCALIRGVATGAMTEAERRQAQGMLNRAARGLSVIGIDAEVVARAPAISGRAVASPGRHSAGPCSDRGARRARLALLSLDQRIRAAARQLGLDLMPA
jgi:hypothetical protein